MRRKNRSKKESKTIIVLFVIAIVAIFVVKSIASFVEKYSSEIAVFLVVLFSVVMLSITTVVVIRYLHKRYFKFVNLHSQALIDLRKINEKYAFTDVKCLYISQEYDNANFYAEISPKDYLIYEIRYKIKEIKDIIEKAKHNSILYPKYVEEVKSIHSFSEYNVKKIPLFKKLLAKIEKKLFNDSILKTVTTVNFSVRLILTNIRRVRKTFKEQVFNEKEILSVLDRLNDRNGDYYNDPYIWQAICRVERGKVTNRIRFMVYNRDGNRCVKCGSRYNLEVDHIFPISKGGKSTVDNLQTLCHNCNQLKSNNIELYAVDPKLKRFGVGDTCPLCGSKLIVRQGRNGSFVGCTAFPKCKYTKSK